MSEIGFSPLPHQQAPQRQCKTVVVCAPKGGVGKTTIVRSLLVSAAKDGVNALGVNMDDQRTLHTWSIARERSRQQFPTLSKLSVWQCQIEDYRRVWSSLSEYDVTFFDTPPGHGVHASEIASLCEKADLVLIPTSTTSDDISEVKPFMIKVAKNKGSFVLNRVNRRTQSFIQGRNELVQAGAVCPVEIPLLEDIHRYFRIGMTAIDAPKADGAADLEAMWHFVRQKIGI